MNRIARNPGWRKSHAPRTRRRRWAFGFAELRIMVLAGMAAGLVWAQIPDFWQAESPSVAAAPRDPWAESRRSAALLRPQEAAPPNAFEAPPRALAAIRFGFCHSGGGDDCVVDGDTFRLGGERIRIADIDTPETHPPRCAREAELGAAATRRLHALLNAGPVALQDHGQDRYGRRLAIVSRGGRSLGDSLVAEGLARPYSGGRRAGWCG